MMIFHINFLAFFGITAVCAETLLTETYPDTFGFNNPALNGRRFPRDARSAQRDTFLDNLVNNLTVPELGMESEHLLSTS